MADAKKHWYTHSAREKDRQDGPFDLEQVLERLSLSELTSADYAWCPGMSAWKQIRDIEELQNTSEDSATDIVQNKPSVFESPTHFTTIHLSTVDLSSEAPQPLSPVLISPSVPIREPSPLPARGGRTGRYRLLFLGVVSCVLICLALSMLNRDTLWSLWFERFPKIASIRPADYQTLRTAALSRLDAGPTLQLAVTTEAAKPSSVYVASNLKGPARFEIRLEAIPSTLVDAPQSTAPVSVTLQKHLGKTTPFEIPAGYYWVHVSPSPVQPESVRPWIARLSSPLTLKAFFGGLPDLGYRTKLKDYQMVRTGKIRAELDGLRDIAGKADALIRAESNAASGLVRLKSVKARQGAWELFDPNWKKDFRELDALLKSPAVFFPKTRQLAELLRSKLEELHGSIATLVAPPAQPVGSDAPFASQYSQLSSASIASAQATANTETLIEQVKVQIKEFDDRISNAGMRLSESQTYFEAETLQ